MVFAELNIHPLSIDATGDAYNKRAFFVLTFSF